MARRVELPEVQSQRKFIDMKKLAKITSRALIIIFLIGLAACNSGSESSTMAMPESKELAMRQDVMAAEEIERKLIKEGRVEFRTDDLGKTRATITEAVNKYQGYISSDSEYKSSGRISQTLTVRVPAENFDAFMADATKGIERFDSKNLNVRDVTEEYIDTEARLKTKKELEARYLELLNDAKNVTEVLAIEKEIGQLRSEIESIEGRLNYLKKSVAYATVDMTFYQRIAKETAFGEKFGNGFRNGWNNLIWFFVILANIWPFILIGLIMLGAIWIYYRRKIVVK